VVNSREILAIVDVRGARGEIMMVVESSRTGMDEILV
jgi:hypothetical protein